MMDTMLAYHLLKAAPLGATIVFVGDVHQLPSVGPGNVLGDLIASGAMPVVELVEVFRQAGGKRNRVQRPPDQPGRAATP